jgi:hypothetical protein
MPTRGIERTREAMRWVLPESAKLDRHEQRAAGRREAKLYALAISSKRGDHWPACKDARAHSALPRETPVYNPLPDQGFERSASDDDGPRDFGRMRAPLDNANPDPEPVKFDRHCSTGLAPTIKIGDIIYRLSWHLFERCPGQPAKRLAEAVYSWLIQGRSTSDLPEPRSFSVRWLRKIETN